MSEGSPQESTTEAILSRHPLQVFRADGTLVPAPEKLSITPFDFRKPVFLAEAELRRLRAKHQEYLRTLSARFSSYLRTDFTLQLASLGTVTYGQFVETIQEPTHITLFKVEPLSGIGLIELQPRLAMAISNRMLGGKGAAAEGNRHLTEIEIALLEDVLGIILDEWSLQWREEQPGLAASMLGHESSARFLQTCSRDTIMLVLSVDVLAGETAEKLQIAVPDFLLEPLIKKLKGGRTKEPQGEAAAPVQWRSTYGDISVPVIADWTVPRLSVRDVLELRVGDVIQMPRVAIENTRIRLANTPQFLARAGMDEGRVAVEISAKIKEP